MQRDFAIRKRVILSLLGILVAADLGLGLYSWALASAPQTSQSEFDQQIVQLKLLKGDIDNANRIRADMPAARKDCDDFELSFPPESAGYSSFVADLDEIARKSGLQIVSMANKEKDLEKRHLAEVTIDATVSGDYGSVVRFVNGLQRSEKFYILDGLALSADTQNRGGGAIRVALHLRTYLRAAA